MLAPPDKRPRCPHLMHSLLDLRQLLHHHDMATLAVRLDLLDIGGILAVAQAEEATASRAVCRVPAAWSEPGRDFMHPRAYLRFERYVDGEVVTD